MDNKQEFVTRNIPIDFYDNVSTLNAKATVYNAKATVYWTAYIDWRRWGIKEISPWVSKVVLDYDEDVGSMEMKHQTKEVSENIGVKGCRYIPFCPAKVLVHKDGTVTVDFWEG